MVEHDGFAPLQPVLLDCVFRMPLPGASAGLYQDVRHSCPLRGKMEEHGKHEIYPRYNHVTTPSGQNSP